MTPASVSNTARLKRRPLLGIAVCTIIGTMAGLVLPLNPQFLIVLSAMLLSISVWRLPVAWRICAVFLAWIIVAWALASIERSSPSGRRLGALVDSVGEYVDVIGVVQDDPSRSAAGDAQRFVVRTEGLKRVSHWQRCHGTLWVSYDGHSRVQYGDRIRCSGLMAKRDPAYRAKGTSHVLYADENHLKISNSGCGAPLVSWCLDWRENCAEILSLGIEDYPQHRGLLMALLLGYRQSLPRDLREVFATTGTLHIFAISGLHVGLVAVLIIFALKTAGLSREHWALALLPLLLFYTLGTGMKVSAIRACLMAVVYWSAFLFRRKPDGPSSLALAATLILFFSPRQLVDPGLHPFFCGCCGHHAPIPAHRSGCDSAFSPRSMEVGGRILSGYVGLERLQCMSVKLRLFHLPRGFPLPPLTATYFNVFSPAALLGNLVVVPGSFLVVFTGCLSLLVGSSFPLCAEVFNHANRVFISLLLMVVEWVRNVPGRACVCAITVCCFHCLVVRLHRRVCCSSWSSPAHGYSSMPPRGSSLGYGDPLVIRCFGSTYSSHGRVRQPLSMCPGTMICLSMPDRHMLRVG